VTTRSQRIDANKAGLKPELSAEQANRTPCRSCQFLSYCKTHPHTCYVLGPANQSKRRKAQPDDIQIELLP
jgi:sulfatase maturation enzyme AslB (radical SAM superfamily)